MDTISVVMNTLNEETNIAWALRSVCSVANEIIIVDMHSVDATVSIAESFGARVFYHERLAFADPAREFALSKATGDWILLLDADEVVPWRLMNRLKLHADQLGAEDVLLLPRQNFALGAPIQGLGWAGKDDYQIRFFRNGSVQSTGEIHNFLRVVQGSRVGRLPYASELCILHFSYTDLASVVERVDRYTSIEAASRLDKGRQPSLVRALAVAPLEFIRRYLILGGYRDGWRGFYLATLLATYKLLQEAKMQQLATVGGEGQILKIYEEIAAAAIVPEPTSEQEPR